MSNETQEIYYVLRWGCQSFPSMKIKEIGPDALFCICNCVKMNLI